MHGTEDVSDLKGSPLSWDRSQPHGTKHRHVSTRLWGKKAAEYAPPQDGPPPLPHAALICAPAAPQLEPCDNHHVLGA